MTPPPTTGAVLPILRVGPGWLRTLSASKTDPKRGFLRIDRRPGSTSRVQGVGAMKTLARIVLVAAALGGTACTSSSERDACDALHLINAHGAEELHIHGAPALYCEWTQSAPSRQVHAEWTRKACWQQQAHYTVTSAIEDGTLNSAEWLAPIEPETEPQRVLGVVAKNDLEVRRPFDSVALLIRSGGTQPDPVAGAAPDVIKMIDDALAGTCPTPADQTRFEDSGACTAFLVGEGHVMTALHCYDKPTNFTCDGNKSPNCHLPKACGGEAPNEMAEQVLAFDYTNPDDRWTIAQGLVVEECGGSETASGKDWMVLSFASPDGLGDREPLALPENPPNECTEVKVVGHPLGYWQHQTGTLEEHHPQAWVSELKPAEGTFQTTLDPVIGLSGAPVLTEKNVLLGLFVGGRYTDPAAANGCGLVQCSAAGCTSDQDKATAIDLSTVELETPVKRASGPGIEA